MKYRSSYSSGNKKKRENQDYQQFIEHSMMIGKHRKGPSVMDEV
jgi:hypothetical protein